MKTTDVKRKGRSILFMILFLMVPLFYLSCDKEDEGKKVDLTELEALIETAEDYLASAKEGNAPGQYIRGALAGLQAGLTQAKQVLDTPPDTQEEIEAAIVAFEDEIYAFEAKEIDNVALQFGLTDNSIAVDNSATSAATFNLSSFTFEAWVIYFDKPGFFGQILSTEFYEDGLRGWNLRVGDNDALDFTIADGDESRLQPLENATVPRNAWTHVACTFDGTNMKSYINGQLVGSLDASARTNIQATSALAGKQPLTFGNSAGFAQPERRLIGKLFDIRFWSVARTQAEIQADKNYILTGTEPNLVAYWPFVKSSPQTTIQDATEKFNLVLKNGTVIGSRN